MHLVNRAAADRVVRVAFHQQSPRLPDDGRRVSNPCSSYVAFSSPVFHQTRPRTEWLRPLLQERFASMVTLFDPHASRKNAGKQVMALGGAELAADGGDCGRPLVEC